MAGNKNYKTLFLDAVQSLRRSEHVSDQALDGAERRKWQQLQQWAVKHGICVDDQSMKNARIMLMAFGLIMNSTGGVLPGGQSVRPVEGSAPVSVGRQTTRQR